MHLASDYIHPYKDAGDVPLAAVYVYSLPTTIATLR
jgi:hypothetical protein